MRSAEEIEEYADKMRNNPTQFEHMLCDLLNENGIKYKFQKVIKSKYIADFCLLDYRLVIEIDGNGHNEREMIKSDQVRHGFMKNRGYKTLRIWNRQLITHKSLIIEAIKEVIDKINKKGRKSRYIKGTKQGWRFQPEKPHIQTKNLMKKRRKWKVTTKEKRDWNKIDFSKARRIIIETPEYKEWSGLSNESKRQKSLRGNRIKRQIEHEEHIIILKQKAIDNRLEIINRIKRKRSLMNVSLLNAQSNMEHSSKVTESARVQQ